MSTVTTPPGANESDKTEPASSTNAADALRKQLRSALQNLNRREPLESTYKKLLERNTLTRNVAPIPKNRLYRRIPSRLRERVEIYTREMQGKDPFDRISQRKPLEEAGMRAAFTLREAKEHEQQPLLETTLAATAMHPERKRSLDGMALSLQQANVTKIMKKTNNNNDNVAAAASTVGAADTTRNNTSPVQQSKQREELERQHRQREEARMERERDKKKKKVEEMEQNRKNESNSGGNTNALTQIFKMYWDMEFQLLQNTNPFRTVIDRQSAQYIAPGYFDVITTPMNLTWIKEKVQDRKYTTLTQFFGDIDLMIDNALKYNTQGPYRQASEELKKKHAKIVKSVWKQIKEKKSQHTTKS